MDFVEVRGSSVEVAVEAGLAELGLERDQATITVLEEPAKGFLGLGSKTALVRISAKSEAKKPRSRGRGKGRGGQGGGDRSGGQKQGTAKSGGPKSGNQERDPRSSGGRGGSPGGGGRPRGGRNGKGKQGQRSSTGGDTRSSQTRDRQRSREEEPVDVAEQSRVAQDFLEGLLVSFGLEGRVEITTEDDVIYASVSGEQTEALVGPKASILEAINELLRTIIQRKTHRRARLRLDIGGYNERRRAALKIYTERLAEQVKEEGGELMLEPMNPAERKVVHDAVADIEGVRSFSEGEEPHRSVVLAPDEQAQVDQDDDGGDVESAAGEGESSPTDATGQDDAGDPGADNDTADDEARDDAPGDEEGGDDAPGDEVGGDEEPTGGLRS